MNNKPLVNEEPKKGDKPKIKKFINKKVFIHGKICYCNNNEYYFKYGKMICTNCRRVTFG
jgi:hypothetical protein